MQTFRPQRNRPHLSDRPLCIATGYMGRSRKPASEVLLESDVHAELQHPLVQAVPAVPLVLVIVVYPARLRMLASLLSSRFETLAEGLLKCGVFVVLNVLKRYRTLLTLKSRKTDASKLIVPAPRNVLSLRSRTRQWSLISPSAAS